ncbi:hypothetical protein DTO166G4_4148 [Paecilomyces variotii]|nr:hypothetical protein DTO166G4_4148 [Paecilomyces variotii]KAJ9231166.1 hypothetical protein DTO166G5_6938 [Paecilomyces variotii]KAJ9307653.1 hypothetical protein DTO217A2_2887 [Paecilomyces variotii]KAJ9369096.1 hypothetical protein DTO282E5_6165 [Paecilomyces variotii]
MTLAGTQYAERTGDALTIDIKGSGARWFGFWSLDATPEGAGPVCFEPHTTALPDPREALQGEDRPVSEIAEGWQAGCSCLERYRVGEGGTGKGDKKDDELATVGHEPAVESGLSPRSRAEHPTRQAEGVASHHEPQRGGIDRQSRRF